MSHFWRLLFIPHERNNHRANLLKPQFLLLFIGVYLANQLFLKALTAVKPGVLGYSSEITSQKVYDLTNNQRQSADLPILHYNSTLEASAIKKAQDMFANNYWAHNSPTGTTPWQFFKDAGYQYSVAGENLAKDFYDTDSLLQAWMNSPTHKANIVSDKYQEIGIGVVNGILNGVKTTLVVQHFATPQNINLVSNDTPVERNYLTGKSQVLADNSSTPLPAVSPLQISKIIGLVMFGIIIITLIVDSYITLRNRTHRITGSATSHLGFILIIFILLIFSQQGAIF